MVRSFNSQFAAILKKLERQHSARLPQVRGTILTGTLFAPVFTPLIERLNARFSTGLTVAGVENKYFGGDVSVAGLLTGSDLLSARDRIGGKFVIIPRSTLKSDEEIMLDGMTLQELTVKLGLPVHPFDLKSFAQFLVQPN
jgi:NifB/MoaA-like Fe-S oxidoreductase